MEEHPELLIEQAKKAARLIKSYSDTIRVFGQYDADGITATSIFSASLLRENKSFHVTVLKQLNERTFRRVQESKERLLVFLDFGSGQLNFLNKMTDKKIIIIDHHQSQGKPADHIIQINPLDFGVAENLSSSGTSYLVSRSLDASNKDLSELAIIGAIGDSQAEAIGSDWGLLGLNREILHDAIVSNKVSSHRGLRIWGRTMRPMHKALEYSIDPYIPNVSGSQLGAVKFLQDNGIEVKKQNGSWRTLSDLSQEEQRKLSSAIIIERAGVGHENPEWIFGDVYELLNRPGELRDAGEFATTINACGKMGKAYLGVEICLGNSIAVEKMKDVLDEYRKSIGSSLSWMEKNKEKIKKETAQGIYILGGEKISEHIISNVISILHKNTNSIKPMFGIVASEEGLKISGRASDECVQLGINLKEILSEVSRVLGGEGGGHAAASGATIPAGTEQMFIENVDAMIKEALDKHINTKMVDNSAKQEETTNINITKPIIPEYAKTLPFSLEKRGRDDTGLQTSVQLNQLQYPKETNLQEETYAKTGPKEIGTEREGQAKSSGSERSAERRLEDPKQNRGIKKMEGKGLVQYFGS